MLLSHCNSSKWHNSKQCGSKENIPRVQIRKNYSFIHLFIQLISKQTSKQRKQASNNYRKADGPTDRPPTIDDRRPTDRPTADDRRPTDRRSTDDRRPPTTDDHDRRSTTHDHLLRRLFFFFFFLYEILMQGYA